MSNEVGKRIGRTVYVHVSCASRVIPPHIQEKALTILIPKLPSSFQYNILKWQHTDEYSKLSFIYCPNFDIDQWPEVGDSYTVDLMKETVKFTPKASDPWIYHHKYLMVDSAYKGFNIDEVKEKDSRWASIKGIDKSRIGKKSYWDKNVRPLFDGGIDVF